MALLVAITVAATFVQQPNFFPMRGYRWGDSIQATHQIEEQHLDSIEDRVTSLMAEQVSAAGRGPIAFRFGENSTFENLVLSFDEFQLARIHYFIQINTERVGVIERFDAAYDWMVEHYGQPSEVVNESAGRSIGESSFEDLYSEKEFDIVFKWCFDDLSAALFASKVEQQGVPLAAIVLEPGVSEGDQDDGSACAPDANPRD